MGSFRVLVERQRALNLRHRATPIVSVMPQAHDTEQGLPRGAEWNAASSMSGPGTFLSCQPRRAMSAIGGVNRTDVFIMVRSDRDRQNGLKRLGERVEARWSEWRRFGTVG